jgi:hypothetical protein
VPSSLKCSPPAEIPHRNLSALLSQHMQHDPPLLSHLALITRMISGRDYKPHKSILFYFLQTSVTSSLLGPRMSLSFLFSVVITLMTKYLPQYPITFPPTSYYFIALMTKYLPSILLHFP